MSYRFFLFFILLFIIFIGVVTPHVIYADYIWSSDLGRFVKVGTIVHDTPQGQFEYAQSLEEEGDLDTAEDAYNNLFRKFPNTLFAQDALFHLGLIQEKMQKYYEAFHNYQKIIDYYPHTDKLEAITERQFKIGNLFLSGRRGRIFNVPIRPAMPLAIEVFETIAENAPFSTYGMRAQFNLGIAYKKKGKLNEAIEQFKKFIADYPTSDLKAEAFFQIAAVTFIMSQKKSTDEKLLKEAQEILTEFLERYPNTTDAAKIRDMLTTLHERDAKQIYTIAHYYEKESYLDSAILYYKELVHTYPNTSWAARAQKRLNSFEDPERFLLEGRKVLDQKLDQLYNQKTTLEKEKSKGLRLEQIQKEQSAIEEQIKEVKKDIKRIEKEKSKEAGVRWEALRRKKGELKKKKAELKKKEKHLKKKPSDDLEKAIQRWKESLTAEEYALEMEERELLSLERRLGIKRIIPFADIIMGKGRKIESIKQYKEKKLKKIIEEEIVLEERKKELYGELKRLEEHIKSFEKKQDALLDKELRDKKYLDQEERTLLEEKKKLNVLRDMYKAKQDEYKEVQGFFPSVLGMPKQSVSSLMKSFTKSSAQKIDGKIAATQFEIEKIKQDITFEEKELERFTQLLKPVSHTKEDTSHSSQDQKEVSESTQEDSKNVLQEKIDKRNARKQVMTIQKKINQAHYVIEDTQKKRNHLIHQLEGTVHDIKRDKSSVFTNTLNRMTKPVVFVSQGVNAFVFGLKDKAQVVEKQADKLGRTSQDIEDSEKIQYYKKEIEKLDTLIKKTEMDIIALEFELEYLIDELKGIIEVRTDKDVKKDKSVLNQTVKKKDAYIQELKERLVFQEKALKDLVTQKKAMHSEQEVQEKESKQVDVEGGELKGVDDSDIQKEKKVKLEDEIRNLEEQIDYQKQVVSDMEKRLKIERKDIAQKHPSKRKWMIFETADEKINKELNTLHEREREILKDIVERIDDQQDILVAHQAIIHEKIERSKKRIQQMEKYQDRELDEMKKLQKTLFKELDEVSSQLQVFTEERNQIETSLSR